MSEENTTLFNSNFRAGKRPLILLAGKSGSGKNYWADRLQLNPVVSYTTRPMRTGETDGVEHHFVSEEFYKAFDKRNIIAYTFFNGNHYWATIDEAETKDVYIIDFAGIEYMLKHPLINRDKIIVVYIDLSKGRCVSNMLKRGDDLNKAMERAEHDDEAFDLSKSTFKIDLTITAD